MRLLIADDEENLTYALKAVLEDAGYNCNVCFDGKSAIRLISQEIYDGLILDIMMPEKNGYEAEADQRPAELALGDSPSADRKPSHEADTSRGTGIPSQTMSPAAVPACPQRGSPSAGLSPADW